VRAAARLAKDGGDLFFATLNRSPRAFLLAIVGAEYVLGLLPRGTHEYARLVRPAELDAMCRAAGLALDEVTGMHYNPLTDQYRLGTGVQVNYLAHYHRPPETPPR